MPYLHTSDFLCGGGGAQKVSCAAERTPTAPTMKRSQIVFGAFPLRRVKEPTAELTLSRDSLITHTQTADLSSFSFFFF